MILEIRGLAVDLGGRGVLRDVDLRVSSGELVGLIGPNGAGKTTLLRAVLGLTPTRAGSVSVDGDRVRPRAGTVGYVPQRHELDWSFPVSVEQVVLTGRTGAWRPGRRPRVEDWRAVDRALELVEMQHLRQRQAGQLSGGQRQRVLVARALALDPGVLLLDEPFTGLDLPTQESLLVMLGGLAAAGRAVVLTTHDIASALYTCHRVVLLNRTVVATGTASELRHRTEVWTRTFGVGPDSPFLSVVRAS
ncbi:anchored repeat-type ABC transporter ATP-binding subunit [Nocardioides sp. SYSU D00038]|uniref:anchored repeat-type ABC transporter ATP-binding subunit n=1 Tax=Nocardioides sp. SYSU D00038 TaxID=2812554 RepID=UPI0019679FAD|nr:anchored repeat-type ABC transporter ATP-binding subunit [Nocardioides sp. SYSU D00038]